MKYLIPILFLFALTAQAQESKQFIIDGKVKNTLTIDLKALNQYQSVSIDSMIIYNHLMQPKSKIKNIKAVALKEILSKVEIVTESPKKLSEYYLVCTATDDYKVVLSWNEVFNSKNANNILILTSFETNPTKDVKGNIAMISTTDEATGRRFVKGLRKITIVQAN